MKTYRILIIDDDPTHHLVLEKYLQLSGYQVFHAANGAEGLVQLETVRPDLVLLDVQMPGMDGFQTLENIRKNAANRNISILFLSALERKHLKIKGLELGADDFITKPFDRAELLARINAVLRRSDRHRRLEGVMEGDLSDVDLTELLQSMELGGKTATIRLDSADGEIVVENGELCYSRMGAYTGYGGLLRLFLLEKGFFSIRFNEVSIRSPEPPQPLTAAIMNALREVDEIREKLGQIKGAHRPIRVVGDTSLFPTLEKIKNLPPMPLLEMIVAMEGHPKENMRTLVLASKQRLLKVDQ